MKHYWLGSQGNTTTRSSYIPAIELDSGLSFDASAEAQGEGGGAWPSWLEAVEPGEHGGGASTFRKRLLLNAVFYGCFTFRGLEIWFWHYLFHC